MTSYEDLFEASVLEVIAPPPSLEFPADYTGEKAKEWVARMREPSGDRKSAFFDENLDFFLTINLPYPVDQLSSSSSQDDPSPPAQLLSFLSHLQISYETSYISPSASTPDPPTNSRLSMPPPRNSSMQRNRPGTLLAGNPSMFPPHTPHPIPSAAESDLKYVQSQGTPLVSAIWGDSDTREKEAFALLWNDAEKSWLAVYKMSILVLYMITKVPDPLLCITVSSTLRNRPLAMTGPRKTLAALIDAVGGLKSAEALSPGVRSNGVKDEGQGSGSDDEEILSGLQEVNLLEGLATGPTFTDPNKRLSLPSTRLGSTTRMHAFSLGPAPSAVSADTPVPYSGGIMSPPPGGNLPRAATLRKSFRKTLKTHLGFRVRMRTVFVPYFLLPQNPQNGKVRNPKEKTDNDASDSDSDSDIDDDLLEEQEQREAGNEEHTVVLSVEVENLFSGSSSAGSMPYHFEVERVDVSISGTGARASFIGWGSHGLEVFPLQVGPREQVNLLYAVSFLRGPEVDEFSLARPHGQDKKGPAEELQRAVTIHLIVRPFESVEGTMAYPTHVFPSRWNCVLDLASSSITKQQKRESAEMDEEENNQEYFVLPTPASPFPTAPLPPPVTNRMLTPLTTRSVIPLTAVAGSKRHTIASFESPAHEYARMPKSPMNYQSPTSMLNPNNQPSNSQPLHSSPTPTGLGSSQTLSIPNRASYIPPSIAFQASFPRSPTTYDAPTSPPLPPPPHHSFGASFAPSHGASDSASTINEVLDPASPTATPNSASLFTPYAGGVPRTPAYPAYPSSPGSPYLQAGGATATGATGAAGMGVSVGPSVEIRRERGGGGVPQTPGPTVGGFFGGGGFGAGVLGQISEEPQSSGPGSMQIHIPGSVSGSGVGAGMGMAIGGEPIIVSVGLLSRPAGLVQTQKPNGKHPHHAHAGELYPLDQFTLDIFVFNQSSWTRRFEVSYPDSRERRHRRRRQKARGRDGQEGVKEEAAPGIIPLENRVRIGPLLPATCQSVRMGFLALAPGVHAIDVLTLTDVQSGTVMHLRNVIDIIVREPAVAA